MKQACLQSIDNENLKTITGGYQWCGCDCHIPGQNCHDEMWALTMLGDHGWSKGDCKWHCCQAHNSNTFSWQLKGRESSHMNGHWYDEEHVSGESC